ncbi:MAG: type transport system ATP-binding protein [Frankiales bacterium]|jgi:ABC-2 type transport system ATP-binding protein|nr:type transport system ATP-binding protein [Frankiales bacterium]
MIQANGLTKRYGEKLAVDDVSFTVRPGIVTGFLGPNGAGKSTTMRLIVGLDRQTSGSVTVNGKDYRQSPAPLREVGALLEAKAVHSSRSAYNHLRVLAATHGISSQRVMTVLDLVGLADVGRKRAGAFSLGMGQRLGIASALLGDPGVLILDEPINGLDPEGIRWVRELLTSLAAEGRTVFVSSHLMSEMALTADHVIVVGRGRVIADVPMQQLIAGASSGVVRVQTPGAAQLAKALARDGVTVSQDGSEVLDVTGLSAGQIGQVALDERIVLHGLAAQEASLEEAFMEMTRDSLDFHAHLQDETPQETAV